MKKFAVALINFFDNENKIYFVEAENEVEALKKGVIEQASELDKAITREWMNDDDYTYKELQGVLFDADMSGCAKEIK